MSQDTSVEALDIFHGLSQELPRGMPLKIRKIVTIHDLIFLRFPKLYKQVDVQIYKAKALHACRSAQKIVTISQQTAQDVMSFLNIPESKITVVYQGCHPQFRVAASKEALIDVRKRYGLPQRFILNVGTIEQRKNIMVAVRALALIPQSGQMPLVIMGRETAYKRDVVELANSLGVGHLITFLHGVPFEDFPPIYQAAHLFVYPSLFEGFGIPVVEALESGVPAISSTGSCFTEAGGPSSVYVDPTNAEELAFQIARISENDTLREEMINNGKKFAQHFQPATIAADLFRVYNDHSAGWRSPSIR
jgi:glycosyltransferase involved in cell wall biosynthesis